MMGVGRQCKPAVTWSRGSPFLADLRWVGLSLTKGRRTAQRFGVSVESGDGQSAPPTATRGAQGPHTCLGPVRQRMRVGRRRGGPGCWVECGA